MYGPGRVDPSTMEAVVPGLQYSVSVAASPDVVYGRLVIVMGRGFCTDEAGHRFRRTSNSSFTLRFGTYNYKQQSEYIYLELPRSRPPKKLDWFQTRGATP